VDRATPEVKVGDEVQVVGDVAESDERTEIDISRAASSVIVNSSGNTLPPPIELRPPPLDADARAYFERYEGMLVGVPRAVVVGPTSGFGEFTVVRADTDVTRLFGDDARGQGWRIVVGDGGRGALPGGGRRSGRWADRAARRQFQPVQDRAATRAEARGHGGGAPRAERRPRRPG
jgi:hypothetical protein